MRERRTIQSHQLIISCAVLLVYFCGASNSAAEQQKDLKPQKKIQTALLWSLIPGAGHYYLDEDQTATTYVATFLPLIGAGFWLDERNDDLGHYDEANTFWLLAMKEWELSIFTTYRSAFRTFGFDLKSTGIDDTPLAGLLWAPFQKQNYKDPWVVGAALLGVVAAAYDARNADRQHNDIHRIGVLGADANRDWGTALYVMDSFGLSLGAAVGEEALWRGVLQNELEFAYGKRGGLWTTSLLFGTAHIVDLDGELSGERVAIASIAGLYLGHLFQSNNHRLAKPIAAHFWYNFAVMLTSFAMNPDDNPLGVQVSFKY